MDEPKKFPHKKRKLGRLEIKTKKIEKELTKIDVKAAAFREKLRLEDEPDYN